MAEPNVGSLRSRVIKLMGEHGSQSVNDLCKNLGISNGSSRSVLVKMHQDGQIVRIAKGVYQLNSDKKKNQTEKNANKNSNIEK